MGKGGEGKGRCVSETIPEFNVTVKVRNNLLLRAMRDAGFETGAALSRETGVSAVNISAYLTLRKTPVRTGGEFRDEVWTLSSALGRDPSELFPQAFMTRCLKTNVVEREVYASDMVALLEAPKSPEALMITNEALGSLDAVLATLSRRKGT
jgi:hypothetical protein